MTVPALNIHGVLPPFTGPDPGGAANLMSPYVVAPVDVVNAFGTTVDRLDILTKWLEHREQLRQRGVVSGFQWLDGSFVERKVPKDLDVTTFFMRPRSTSAVEMATLMGQNHTVFGRSDVKASYRLDVFWVDMNARPEAVIEAARYYCGLFSHNRGNFLWKGMLRVDLAAKPVDDIAVAAIQQAITLQAVNTAPSNP